MTDANDAFWTLLIICLWMHVVDDFVLQKACLCELKQRSWWRKLIGYEFDRSNYCYDYVAALLAHAVEWSAGIMLPLMAWSAWKGVPFDTQFIWMAFSLNTVAHAFVDNMKANELSINLIEDQLAHLVQIVITVAVFTMRNFI